MSASSPSETTAFLGWPAKSPASPSWGLCHPTVPRRCEVIEAGDGSCFTLEALGEADTGYFDGDGAFEPSVAGFVRIAPLSEVSENATLEELRGESPIGTDIVHGNRVGQSPVSRFSGSR